MTDFRLSFRAALFALAVVFSLGLFGCGSSTKTIDPGALPEAFPDHSTEEIRTQIKQPTDSIKRAAAMARVQVRSPEGNRSFNAEIRQQRADSLFMRFSLFGFEGGRLLLTPDSVFLYDSRKSKLRVGPIADAQEFLPAPVENGKIFANMLGLIAPPNDADYTVRADSTHYFLTTSSGTEQWTVDPRPWRVVRYERTNAQNRVLEVRQFSDFQLVNGVPLPQTVTFRRPADDVSATISYAEIALNPSGLSYELGVPSNVPREPLRSR